MPEIRQNRARSVAPTAITAAPSPRSAIFGLTLTPFKGCIVAQASLPRSFHRTPQVFHDQNQVHRIGRARLKRWQTQGLTPGVIVHFLSYQPLDDLFQLRVGTELIQVGSESLAGLRGETVTE